VFPETFCAPPLVPEAVDEKASDEVSAEQVMREAAAEMDDTCSEHFVLLNELAVYRARAREIAA
jgi:NAD kinase